MIPSRRTIWMAINVFSETQPITLDLRPVVDMTDEAFFALCQANRDLRLERAATGEIVIIPYPHIDLPLLEWPVIQQHK
jgi:Uma2 family endonuclease